MNVLRNSVAGLGGRGKTVAGEDEGEPAGTRAAAIGGAGRSGGFGARTRQRGAISGRPRRGSSGSSAVGAFGGIGPIGPINFGV